jgi:hypothetical protein
MPAGGCCRRPAKRITPFRFHPQTGVVSQGHLARVRSSAPRRHPPGRGWAMEGECELSPVAIHQNGFLLRPSSGFPGVVGCRRWRWFIRWWWCLRAWLRWRCCGWPRWRRFRRCVGFHLFMKGYSSNGTKRVALILNTPARGCRDGTVSPKSGLVRCNAGF